MFLWFIIQLQQEKKGKLDLASHLTSGMPAVMQQFWKRSKLKVFCALRINIFHHVWCLCLVLFLVPSGHGCSLFFLLLPGPRAQDSCAPDQASSPRRKPAAFLCCLLRESREENLERDPPKGFYSRFTRHSPLELPPFISHSLFNPDYLLSFC